MCRKSHCDVLTPKSALFSLSAQIFVHKLSHPGYFVYENSYKLSKATIWLEFSLTYYPFV